MTVPLNKPDAANPAMRLVFMAGVTGAGSLIRDVRPTSTMRVSNMKIAFGLIGVSAATIPFHFFITDRSFGHIGLQLLAFGVFVTVLLFGVWAYRHSSPTDG